MSDNMKWTEKKEEYGIKGNTFNEGKVIGWNACHEEFMKVIKEQIQISLFESLHPLNQPAEQKCTCDYGVAGCPIHNAKFWGTNKSIQPSSGGAKEVKVSEVKDIEREIDKHRIMVNGQSYYNTTITELIFRLCPKK